MTAPAKPKARRLLGYYPTQAEARFKAIYWGNTEPEGADIQVELGVPGTTSERPWAVTAARTGGTP